MRTGFRLIQTQGRRPTRKKDHAEVYSSFIAALPKEQMLRTDHDRGPVKNTRKTLQTLVITQPLKRKSTGASR